MSIALQGQHRNEPGTPNSKDNFDTFGGSLLANLAAGFTLGFAYNEARDGQSDLDPGEPGIRKGDKAAIFGVRYVGDKMYIAANYSKQDQHEDDDLGRFFDGKGLEIFGYYVFDDHWKFDGGYVNLSPSSSHPGEYKLNYGYLGLGYLISSDRPSAVFIEARFDGSKASDGTSLRNSVLALGVNFDF